MLIPKKKLKNALRQISIFVDRSANKCGNPILFETKDGIVTLTACDGSNIGIFSFPVKSESEFAFVIHFKGLDTITALRGDIDFEYHDSALIVQQAGTSIMFAVSGKNTFAFEERAIADGGFIKIDSSKFKKLIGKVSYARREKDARPFVTGVNLSFDGTKLKAEATDALRMLRDYTTLEGFEGQSFKGVLSPKCIKAIESMDDNKELTIRVNDNAICFLADDMRVYMPKLNCPYPDATRFFTIDAKATFVLDKDKTLESMTIFAKAEEEMLRCKKQGRQILFSMNNESANYDDIIDMEFSSGDDFEFGIEFDGFRTIFQNLKVGNKVTFFWQAPQETIIFKDEENLEGVTMPLKLPTM